MPAVIDKTGNKIRRFLHVESEQIPLVEIPFTEIKQTIIDPTTRKPYNGILLQGIFADLSNKSANVNNRFYDVPQYLKMLQILRKQIHSSKGVYGELEHPKSYIPSFKNASHKIIDVWYEEDTQIVKGIIMLLNTPNGLICQEIIKSGGQLSISGRAAGEEIERPDGTKMATTKLLTTYDIVYNSGFANAQLDLMGLSAPKELNESSNIFESAKNRGFSFKFYDSDIKNIPNKFKEYVQLNENTNSLPKECFYEWFYTSLNESQKEGKNQQEQQIDILQKNQTNDQNKIQNQLQKATDQDLSESEKLNLQRKKNYLKQMYTAQQRLKGAGALYDDSFGFVNSYSDTNTAE